MSTEKPITVTRAELHRRVWNTPMRTLAKEFGLSDVGLARNCEKHQIPRPPVGHWVRIESGYDPEQTPSPDIEDAKLDLVNIAVRESRSTLSGKMSIQKPERCRSQRRSRYRLTDRFLIH